jgi:hypothetical protein
MAERRVSEIVGEAFSRGVSWFISITVTGEMP